jgi:hypothetical protein
VDQSGWLEGVPRRLRRHPRRRELSQFVVYERQKLCGSLSVALVSGFQEMSYLSHTPEFMATGAEPQHRGARSPVLGSSLPILETRRLIVDSLAVAGAVYDRFETDSCASD